MLEVAVIGAGELGGALAFLLASQGRVSGVCLIDDEARVAEGKALDIAQSAPIQHFATRVTGARDLLSSAGAHVIVIADRLRSAGSADEEMLARIAANAPDSLLICAGARHRELVESGVRDRRFARSRLFGSAPEALASALRAVVALEAGCSARDVSLSVLGIPPDQTVVPWEEATIGGFAIGKVLDDTSRRRIAGRVAPLWPPGPYALAAAAAKAIDGVGGVTRQVISCFLAPDDEFGRRARAVAVPARLDARGATAVDLPPLNVHDQTVLETAMLL
jgi:malate dehydrogenase